MKMYSWHSKFDFGKFHGNTLKQVFKYYEGYIFWCLVHVKEFCITDEIFNNLYSVKQYNIANKKYLESGDPKDKYKALEFQYIHDGLLRIHTQKSILYKNLEESSKQTIRTKLYKTQEKSSKQTIKNKLYKTQEKSYRREDYYENDDHSNSYNSNNWLIEAAGTDDPRTLNDVYWNLD